MNKKMMLILELLSDGVERFGLELLKASNGGLRHATIYSHLARLEKMELISSKKEPDPIAPRTIHRRLYKITGDGEGKLRELEEARKLNPFVFA